MKLKASKCEFGREKIKFLGFVLSKDGICPNPEKTQAIDNYPTPTTPTEVKAFLDERKEHSPTAISSSPIWPEKTKKLVFRIIY